MARGDRTGNRIRRSSFRQRTPDLGYYIIVTDTNETEANYLYGLRDSLPKELQGRLVIKVLQANSTENLVRKCKEQIALTPQYGQPWIVFDRDRVVNFNEIIRVAEREGIEVGWSNPCIEVWFEAYFGKMNAYPDSVTCCNKFAEIFERKTGQEYKKANPQIYGMLNRYGDEENAVKTAQTRLEQYMRDGITKPSDMNPCTTVHRLVGEVREKAGK